jgi:serine phosphatase RsbU (regulator of sigma subunit)
LDKAAAALAAFIGEADQFDDITLMAIKRSLA